MTAAVSMVPVDSQQPEQEDDGNVREIALPTDWEDWMSDFDVKMPFGWEPEKDEDGTVYFINHVLEQTSWVDPRFPLPHGWQAQVLPSGQFLFILKAVEEDEDAPPREKTLQDPRGEHIARLCKDAHLPLPWFWIPLVDRGENNNDDNDEEGGEGKEVEEKGNTETVTTRSGTQGNNNKDGKQEQKEEGGQLYWLDIRTNTSSWVDPRDPLPVRWVAKRTSDKHARLFFVDVVTGKATHQDPRVMLPVGWQIMCEDRGFFFVYLDTSPTAPSTSTAGDKRAAAGGEGDNKVEEEEVMPAIITWIDPRDPLPDGWTAELLDDAAQEKQEAEQGGAGGALSRSMEPPQMLFVCHAQKLQSLYDPRLFALERGGEEDESNNNISSADENSGSSTSRPKTGKTVSFADAPAYSPMPPSSSSSSSASSASAASTRFAVPFGTPGSNVGVGSAAPIILTGSSASSSSSSSSSSAAAGGGGNIGGLSTFGPVAGGGAAAALALARARNTASPTPPPSLPASAAAVVEEGCKNKANPYHKCTPACQKVAEKGSVSPLAKAGKQSNSSNTGILRKPRPPSSGPPDSSSGPSSSTGSNSSSKGGKSSGGSSSSSNSGSGSSSKGPAYVEGAWQDKYEKGSKIAKGGFGVVWVVAPKRVEGGGGGSGVGSGGETKEGNVIVGGGGSAGSSGDDKENEDATDNGGAAAVEEELYAMKLITKARVDKDFKQACLREIEMLRMAGPHPFIVSLKEAFVSNASKEGGVGGAFSCALVMELCPGGTLFDFIQARLPGQACSSTDNDAAEAGSDKAPEGGANGDRTSSSTGQNGGGGGAQYVEEEAIMHIFGQLALAVAHLHSEKIWHLDIKTSNIFIGADGNTRLGDFGLACKAMHMNKSRKKADQEFNGTLEFAAPEQILSNEVDYKTDVWAAGIVLYQLIALRMPFEGNGSNVNAKTHNSDLQPLIKQITTMPYPDLPGPSTQPYPLTEFAYSADLGSLLGKLLYKKPRFRPHMLDILMSDYLQAHLPENMRRQ